jgi:peptide/nickel transport system ATP-binding protein
MLNMTTSKPLLEIRDLHIEGHYEDAWHPLIKGIDLTLQHGEVLGLIVSPARASRPSACQPWATPVMAAGSPVAQCISTASICSRPNPKALRKLRGLRIAYVAQSAAASFNPAHRLIDQHVETAVKNGGMSRDQAMAEAVDLYRVLRLPNPETIGQRYPHQVSGGQLQRVDDRDGHVLPART